MNNTSQDRIRVLRIINRFNLGGITYNVSYLSRYLPARFETLLAGGPEEDSEESSLFIPRSLGLDPVLIMEMRRSVNPFSDYFAYRRIRKMIRDFKPHIVHTHASKAGAIGRLAAAHSGVPVIVHTFHGHVFHGYFGSFKTGVFKTIEKYLARRSNAIVAISAAQKHELTTIHAVCKADKTFVIPLGFDLTRFATDLESKRTAFRKQYGIDDDTIAIGIIGRLVPIKNHALFIDAAGHVMKSAGKKIKALIIGDGESRAGLESKIRAEYPENSPFIFTGWCKDADVALAGLDIVALTSLNEGTPVSLIEAQAAGRFIVTTNVGGISDILHPGCGFMSPPDDHEGFKVNLLKAVSEFTALSAQADVAREDVLQKFSYKRLCSDMTALYEKLLREKGML